MSRDDYGVYNICMLIRSRRCVTWRNYSWRRQRGRQDQSRVAGMRGVWQWSRGQSGDRVWRVQSLQTLWKSTSLCWDSNLFELIMFTQLAFCIQFDNSSHVTFSNVVMQGRGNQFMNQSLLERATDIISVRFSVVDLAFRVRSSFKFSNRYWTSALVLARNFTPMKILWVQ